MGVWKSAARPPRATGSLSAAGCSTYTRVPGGCVAPEGARFGIITNRLWNGAKQVVEYSPARSGVPEALNSYVVWGMECKRGKQRITLDRSIDLPGPPTAARINATAYSVWSSSPLKSLKVFVHGQLMNASEGDQTTPLNLELVAAQLAAFRYGQNTG